MTGHSWRSYAFCLHFRSTPSISKKKTNSRYDYAHWLTRRRSSKVIHVVWSMPTLCWMLFKRPLSNSNKNSTKSRYVNDEIFQEIDMSLIHSFHRNTSNSTMKDSERSWRNGTNDQSHLPRNYISLDKSISNHASTLNFYVNWLIWRLRIG